MATISKTRLDYTGQKFNFLTALRFSRWSGRASFWNFQCDCGNTAEIRVASVKGGHTKSCGCKKTSLCARAVLPNGRAIINEAFAMHKYSAKKRSIRSDLTREQFEEIIRKPCTYCGDFSERKNTHTGRTLTSTSVDRRDNEPFYTLENSIPACFECQHLKMDMTEAEFFCKIEKILARRGTR